MSNYAMTIMLVDDDDFALKLIEHQLNELGYRNIVAHTKAESAITQLAAGEVAPDVLFFDLQMPNMDGVELMRQLAEQHYLGRIVLMSGEDSRILNSAEKLANIHQLRILSAIAKPIESKVLTDLLERVEQFNPPIREHSQECSPQSLKHAIDNKILENYYQPKIDLKSGAVAGMETLVRWPHPILGFIAPEQFIGVAERNGLIDDLTDLVLENTLIQMKRWYEAELAFSVAINVSMDNLNNVAFADKIVDALKSYGSNLLKLVLEVTESQLMRNPEIVMDVLTRLRLKNIGLSIDDFGTGHSSLQQLKDLPFSELKIDRGFVNNASNDRSIKAIMESSLDMAQKLGIKTVAEGVETIEDWQLLLDSGCDMAQGFFIAKPMPGGAVLPWLAQWEKRKASLFEGRLND